MVDYVNATRVSGAALMVTLTLVWSCAPRAAAPDPPEPAFFLLAVPTSVDSTIALARVALREVNGALHPPSFANGVTTVSAHYTRTRQDGGETRVAVVLEISHKIVDPSVRVTAVRLSAWALDYAGEFLSRPATQPTVRPPRAPASPAVPMLLNSRPRAITDQDDADVSAMLSVMGALMNHGARRMP